MFGEECESWGLIHDLERQISVSFKYVLKITNEKAKPLAKQGVTSAPVIDYDIPLL